MRLNNRAIIVYLGLFVAALTFVSPAPGAVRGDLCSDENCNACMWGMCSRPQSFCPTEEGFEQMCDNYCDSIGDGCRTFPWLPVCEGPSELPPCETGNPGWYSICYCSQY